MIENRKGEGSVRTLLLHVIRKSSLPSENTLTAILTQKKPKSLLEFEPSLLRQNAIALQLTFEEVLFTI